jgi:predicted phosphoadenosine phosphosulfate sulfurtransferase
MIGVHRNDQRVCPPYGEEPLQGLWQYAQCWPELWDKMINRVPGAATAGRYCRSPLYAFGDWQTLRPPEGLSWKEAIRKEITKFPPDVRAKIAKRMKDEIALHNRRTGNAPIPDNTQTGLCWRWLYMVAVRGDLKGRKGVWYDEATLKVELAGNHALKDYD